MNRYLTVVALVLMLLACSKTPKSEIPAVQPVKHEISWLKPDGADVTGIFDKAKSANKPVFLYWGAVWCPPCNQIKATVFNRQDFIELSQLFVPVYVDGDSKGAQKLGAQFKVRGYPTMILFKPDGTELTRLPGEVDAAKYMEVLRLGLSTGSSTKEYLATALGGSAGGLPPEAWRLLAYYAWDQDQAQLVPPKELAPTLHKLTQACPATQPDACSRLALKAVIAFASDKTELPDQKASLNAVQHLLADTALVRQTFDVLAYYATDIVSALTHQASPERKALTSQWNLALDQLTNDVTLSKSDRLTAIEAKVALAKLDQTRDSKTELSASLITQVREAVANADSSTTSTYERQAVIPNAADLLSEAGLLDESDTMLKTELPKALSPYYHMLVLASNAKSRGDTTGALDWAERAWNASKGPATRLQWGSGFVIRLIELTPQDSKRIETAATKVISELDANEETFFERNRRGLEKIGQQLGDWSHTGKHSDVLKRLRTQMNAVCAKLPSKSEAQTACSRVFAMQVSGTKT